MSNQEEVQKVQQQIKDDVRKASEMEESFAREKQAGDPNEVQYLRNRLLEKELRLELLEKENLLLRAQQRGEHNHSVTTGL